MYTLAGAILLQDWLPLTTGTPATTGLYLGQASQAQKSDLRQTLGLTQNTGSLEEACQAMATAQQETVSTPYGQRTQPKHPFFRWEKSAIQVISCKGRSAPASSHKPFPRPARRIRQHEKESLGARHLFLWMGNGGRREEEEEVSSPIPKCPPGPAHRPRLIRPHHKPMESGLISSISQIEKLTCPR